MAKAVNDHDEGPVGSAFPTASTYSIPYDTTRFVEVSIREVLITLGEAMVLVFLVVFLFLQNWRATLIPIIAVPVSLIGTFAGLFMLGYSINTLTLFGMVLAIGIVVDDAIVVLENVERIMHEEHMPAREAAIQAMKEVTGPDHRHRAGAVRGVRADRLPGRPDGRAVPPVRRHDLDRRGHLRHRRADADARAVRADPQEGAQGHQPGVRRASTAASPASPAATPPAWLS